MARVVHVGVEPLAIAVKLAGAPRRAVGERVLEHHPRRVRDDELLVVAGVDPERLVRLPAVGVIGLRVADVGVGPDPLAAVLVEAAGAAAVQVQLHDIDDGHRPAPLAGRGVAPAPGLFDAGRVEMYVPVAVEPHRELRPRRRFPRVHREPSAPARDQRREREPARGERPAAAHLGILSRTRRDLRALHVFHLDCSIPTRALHPALGGAADASPRASRRAARKQCGGSGAGELHAPSASVVPTSRKGGSAALIVGSRPARRLTSPGGGSRPCRSV